SHWVRNALAIFSKRKSVCLSSRAAVMKQTHEAAAGHGRRWHRGDGGAAVESQRSQGSAPDDAAIQAFREGLDGEVLRPGGGAHDTARRVWNGMIDRRPALIVRCAAVADVQAAVRFARQHKLLVAVRGGGHNVAGNAVCEGGIVIDLSRMRGVWVDPARRT